jgi:hypothetical protein
MKIIDRFIDRITQRPADFIIGGRDDPYLYRWWVIPRNRWFNVYLHCFARSDDDRALHDHPWLFNCSVLLRGQYREWTFADKAMRELKFTDRKAGAIKLRLGGAPHRVELFRPAMAVGNGAPRPIGREMPCWTLFITGPVVREWGFHCPNGWVHWKLFTDARDSGSIGRGCDQP